jgi:Domain of unknown function (DUF1772)
VRDLTFASWMLMTATFCVTAVASVGVYQSLFVMPEYFSSPPASLRRYQADRSWTFWLPLHAVTLPALVLSLITTWSTERRGLVLAASICYAASWVATAIWFIPGVIEFNKVDVDGPYSEELAAKGRRWLRQSTGRLVLMLAAAVLLVIALGT